MAELNYTEICITGSGRGNDNVVNLGANVVGL